MNERKTDKLGKMKAGGTRCSLPAVAGVSKSCGTMTLQRSASFRIRDDRKSSNEEYFPLAITLVSEKQFSAAKCCRHDMFVGLATRIGSSSVRSAMSDWGKHVAPTGLTFLYRVGYRRVAPTALKH